MAQRGMPREVSLPTSTHREWQGSNFHSTCFIIMYMQAQGATMDRASTGGEARPEVAYESQREPRANGTEIPENQGLLEGLLQDRPARSETGEDLMLWLELREQNQLGSGEEPLPSSEDMVDIVDGAVNSHQQAAEVRSSGQPGARVTSMARLACLSA